jgi:hypothetical protein
MPSRRRRILPILLTVMLGAAQLGGCAGIPVQEMSNARQAVRAAQKAGAEKYAPAEMTEAERLLKSAKANLSKGEYRTARDEAEQAREKAMEARRIAESATGKDKPGP